jgi:hypothetical protein
MLEPDVLKGTRPVLRGERGSNAPDLPDVYQAGEPESVGTSSARSDQATEEIHDK